MSSLHCPAVDRGSEAVNEANGWHPRFIASEVSRLQHGSDLTSLPSRQLCKARWLFYRGDDNYGLGNVVYDMAAAAALALVLNRSLVYGTDANDRKFGSLLHWPGVPTMKEVDAHRRRAKCGVGPLRSQRRVSLNPAKCTLGRAWRREKTGHLRCFRRLLGVNWLKEHSPIIELAKVTRYVRCCAILRPSQSSVD